MERNTVFQQSSANTFGGWVLMNLFPVFEQPEALLHSDARQVRDEQTVKLYLMT